MKFRPLQDKILVQPLEAPSTTKGGIIIPDGAKEKPVRGEVIAVGPGKTLPNGRVQEMDIKKGDVVIYGQYAGTEIEVDGAKLRIVSYDDCHAVE